MMSHGGTVTSPWRRHVTQRCCDITTEGHCSDGSRGHDDVMTERTRQSHVPRQSGDIVMEGTHHTATPRHHSRGMCPGDVTQGCCDVLTDGTCHSDVTRGSVTSRWRGHITVTSHKGRTEGMPRSDRGSPGAAVKSPRRGQVTVCRSWTVAVPHGHAVMSPRRGGTLRGRSPRPVWPRGGTPPAPAPCRSLGPGEVRSRFLFNKAAPGSSRAPAPS